LKCIFLSCNSNQYVRAENELAVGGSTGIEPSITYWDAVLVSNSIVTEVLSAQVTSLQMIDAAIKQNIGIQIQAARAANRITRVTRVVLLPSGVIGALVYGREDERHRMPSSKDRLEQMLEDLKP